MTEWVLIIWTITCGWSCSPDNVHEFAAYKTQAGCREALFDWTITERTRHMQRKYRIRDYDHDGKCMPRPRTGT